MIKKILVPIDGSEYARVAVKYAVNMAQAYQAQLLLFSVIDIRQIEGPFITQMAGTGDTGLGVHIAALSDWLERRSRSYLATVRPECEAAGMICDTKLVTGVVSNEIIEQAKTCDIVVMGRHGEHVSFRGPLLGSTLENVVRGTLRPVFTTPGKYAPIRRILVAYDHSRFASGALTVAAELAKGLEVPVVLLTVDRDPNKAKETVNSALGYLEPYKLETSTVIASGEPSEEILRVCRQEDCNLIAMGAYGHSALREFILGSTTARVMHKATCPVLLFR